MPLGPGQKKWEKVRCSGQNKTISLHDQFVYCYCHKLQQTCVQAENVTSGIEHVYVILTTLWKFFHCFSKCAESLKEVQKVLNRVQLKTVKPTDTHWLTHKRCVQAMKASYSAIVTCLDIYTDSYVPEALNQVPRKYFARNQLSQKCISLTMSYHNQPS